MQTLKEALLEAETFFEKYAREYPCALSAYEEISALVDTALQQNNYDLLLSQISCMETGNGRLAFQYIGEARQLFRILSIIALEQKYHTCSFAYHMQSKQELIEKYRLSLFALRRILFTLSPASTADAEAYLREAQLSPFAIYMLAKEELLIPDNVLFKKLQALYRSQWNHTEMQLFQQFIHTFTEA